MENEFTPKIYKEIRDRGHFTIIDDGSVQEELSRKLLKLKLSKDRTKSLKKMDKRIKEFTIEIGTILKGLKKEVYLLKEDVLEIINEELIEGKSCAECRHSLKEIKARIEGK